MPVWDWTIRFFHWSLVLLIGLMWWSAENDHMDWHMRIGQLILAIFMFRIYWGFFGPETARFRNLIHSPKSVLAYIRAIKKGRIPRSFGHSPSGALSVIAMLLCLASMLVLGLFSVDVNGMVEGPLAYLLDFDTARKMASLHELVFKLLQGLIILHILAILIYRFMFKTDLVTPMLTGRKQNIEHGEAGQSPVTAPVSRILPGILLVVAVMFVLRWFS